MKNILLSLLFVGLFAFASGDHAEKESITGSGFDLIHVNSVLVGTLENKPIWAEKKCGSHIRGIIKVEDQIHNFSVEITDRVVIGNFKEKQIRFNRLDKENKQIILKADSDVINIEYETTLFDSQDGHYHGITFKFNNNEQEYSLFLDGETCMGSMIFYSIFFYGLTTY